MILAAGSGGYRAALRGVEPGFGGALVEERWFTTEKNAGLAPAGAGG
ncbi:hypothetical protein [Streptomyces sp. CA-106131]